MSEKEISMEDILARAKKASETKPSNDYAQTEREFEHIEWLGLVDKTYTIVHPVGPLYEQRKEPWHAKFVLHSRVITDSGFKVPFYWPYETDEFNLPTQNIKKDFILYKMYKAISKGCTDYREVCPATGDYAHTEAFKRIMWNKTAKELEQINGRKYKNQFLGKPRVLIPVWDAEDEFCKANNKTQILTAKKDISKVGDKSYDNSEIGISLSLYNTILTEVVDYNDNSWDTDIIIERDSAAPGRGEIAKTYIVNRASDPAVVKKVSVSIGRTPSVSPVDPAILAKLTHHNLDKIGNTWSHSAMYKHFLNLAKEIDGVCHTNFAKELAELKEAEQEEWKKAKAEETKTVSPVSKPEEKAEVKSEAPKTASRTPIKKEKVSTKEEVLTECQRLPFWENLSDTEKSIMVSGIKGFDSNGNPILEDSVKEGTASDEEVFMPCANDVSEGQCGFPVSLKVNTCPKCGVQYGE